MTIVQIFVFPGRLKTRHLSLVYFTGIVLMHWFLPSNLLHFRCYRCCLICVTEVVKMKCMGSVRAEGGGEQGGKSPFSLLSEPISPSSLNGYVSFSPSSLLFPLISPSSQLFLGHFSLLPILFLPPSSG